MKYLAIIIVGLVCLSCESTTEPECQVCRWVTESNEFQARLYCQGLANNYPKFDVTDESTPFSVCSEDALETLKLSETTEFKTMCLGISGTTNVRLICE